MNNTENHIYVIFGASGDLTKRKLVPAIYSLFVQNLLPEKFVLLGVSRTEFSDDEFRTNMKSAIKEFKEIDDDSKIDEFIKKRKAKELIDIFGTIDYDASYDYKKMRSR